MIEFKPIKTTVADAREKENMIADVARNKAYNDYIAMMCDVDIPETAEETEVFTYEE